MISSVESVATDVYREGMAPTHGEIVKQLGDGWSVAWDATATDAKTRSAMDSVVEASTEALIEAIAAPAQPGAAHGGVAAAADGA